MVSSLATPPNKPEVVEFSHPHLLPKLLNTAQYIQSDINLLCKQIMSDNAVRYDGFDLKRTFETTCDHNSLKEHINTYSRRRAIFSIHRRRRTNIWTLICIVNTSPDEVYVFYKNPANGEAVPKEVTSIVETDEYLRQKKIIYRASLTKDISGNNNVTGPITVRNFKFLLDKLSTSLNDISDSETWPFYTEDNIKREKINLAIYCLRYLCRKDDFHEFLQEFLDNNLKEVSDLCRKTTDFRKGDFKFDNDEDFDKWRKSVLGQQDQLEEFSKKIKKAQTHKDISKMRTLFAILDCCEGNEHLKNMLDIISRMFNIPLTLLEDSFRAINANKSIKIASPPKFTLDEVSPIKDVDNNGTYSIDEYINLMRFSRPAPTITEIKTSYNKILAQQKIWSVKSLTDINTWALSKRNKNIDESQDSIIETIAIMTRLVALKFGLQLVISQMMSLLTFLLKWGTPKARRGLKIPPSEDKPLIIALLAAIKVLQGSHVDIIVDNSTQAPQYVTRFSTIFGVLGISVSADVQDAKSYDIVYGCISNFQFEYLRDIYNDNPRKYDTIIVSSVDVMLQDNFDQVATLSNPFLGFDSLRYVYLNVWQSLIDAEKEIERDYRDKFEVELQRTKKRVKKALLTKEQAQESIDKFLKSIKVDNGELKSRILASDPCNCELLCGNIKKYAMKKIDRWIDVAIFAKYHCNVDENYRIINGKIVVVDCDNTGMELGNVVWKNGLLQFLEIKHNLRISGEVLSSRYISNLGYAKLYKDENFYGFIDNVETNWDILDKVFGVAVNASPAYKKDKKGKESEMAVDDDIWSQIVAIEAMSKIKQNSSVLVISATLNSLKTFQNAFENYKKIQTDYKFTLTIIDDQVKYNEAVKQEIGPGNIILTTNLASRGEYFKTNDELEKAGGLQIFVTFFALSENLRGAQSVRTRIRGKEGAITRIFKKSEISRFKSAKTYDIGNKDRVVKYYDEVKANVLPKIFFKDQLHREFVKFYNDKKNNMQADYERYLILRDLEESFALWLDWFTSTSNLNVVIAKSDAKREFLKFTDKYDLDYIDFDCISCRNPFYDIQRAEFLIQNSPERARDILLKAVSHEKISYSLLYSAHVKLFEAVIKLAHQEESKIAQVLSDIISLNYKSEEAFYCMTTALKHLEKARKCIVAEIRYIESNFIIKNGDFDHNFGILQVINRDLIGENLMLKHFYSRLTLLKLFQGNIEQLIKDIDFSLNHKKSHIIIRNKVSDFYAIFDKDKRFTNKIANDDIIELKSIGLSSLYVTKFFYDLRLNHLEYATCLVSSGVVISSIASNFVIFKSFLNDAAIVFLCEGITDIIYLMMGDGHIKPPQNRQLLGVKIIDNCREIITNISTPQIFVDSVVKEALKGARSLTNMLIQAKEFHDLCDGLDACMKPVFKIRDDSLKAALEEERDDYRCDNIVDRVVAAKLSDEIIEILQVKLVKKLSADHDLCKVLLQAQKSTIKEQIHVIFAEDKALLQSISRILPTLQGIKQLGLNLYNVPQKADEIVADSKIVNFEIISNLSNALKSRLTDDSQHNGPLNVFMEEIARTIAMHLVKPMISAIISYKEQKANNYFMKDDTFNIALVEIRAAVKDLAKNGLETAMRSASSVAKRIFTNVSSKYKGKIGDEAKSGVEKAFMAASLEALEANQANNAQQVEFLKGLREEVKKLFV